MSLFFKINDTSIFIQNIAGPIGNRRLPFEKANCLKSFFAVSFLKKARFNVRKNVVDMNLLYNVLISGEDKFTADLLKTCLDELLCEVVITENIIDAIHLSANKKFDLAILNITLAEIASNEICKSIRATNPEVSIIILASEPSTVNKVIALEAGADEYLTKPLNMREFSARVKTLLRRVCTRTNNFYGTDLMKLKFDGLEIDLAMRKIVRGNMRVELSPKEFELLKLLASNPGKSYSRQRLLSLVWGYDFDGYEHTINSHINRLRNKIENDIGKPKYILTTWGYGYRFNEEL